MKCFILFLLIASVTCVQANAQNTEDDQDNFSAYVQNIKNGGQLDQAIDPLVEVSNALGFEQMSASNAAQYLEAIKQMTSKPSAKNLLAKKHDDYNTYASLEGQHCRDMGDVPVYKCRLMFLMHLNETYGIDYPKLR
jgi:hypothetical protein